MSGCAAEPSVARAWRSTKMLAHRLPFFIPVLLAGLGAAQTAPAHAEPAGRAGGLMITPDVPGASQSCIGPQENRWVAGARLVLRDCRPNTDKGFSHDNSEVTAVDGPLCVVAPGRGEQLALADCAGAPMWGWVGSASKAAPIRTDDGLCWVIPALDDPNTRFPFPVFAAPCKGGREPPLGFFFSRN